MRKLPFDLERVNIKVCADDWQWMGEHMPGQRNRVLRDLLRAYVARERQRRAHPGT